MADLRVRRVEFDSTQAANQPFPLRVKINNLETVGPAGWGPGVCPDGGVFTNNGHYANVSATIRDANGDEVWSEEVQECIPVNRPSEALGANAVVEFTPSLSSGEYSVQASVEFRGQSGDVDTTNPRSLTVESDTSGLPAGDDGGNPWFDPFHGDDDGASGGQERDDDRNQPSPPDAPEIPSLDGIGTGALLALLLVGGVLLTSGGSPVGR